LKKTLLYLAGAVGVLLLALVALPFFISVHSLRPAVEHRLSSALGRQVRVGNLSFSIFSRSLSAENLSIADDPEFSKSPFLTATLLKVGVELWPLITSKTLNVTGLTIERPEVKLVRNRQGKWNVSTLATGSSRPPSAAKSGGGGPPEFTVAKLKLEKGRVTVGSTFSDRKSVYDNVDIQATHLSPKSPFPVTLTAVLPGGGGAKADGKVGPLNQADALLSPLATKVTLNSLDLATTGFVDPGAGMAGILDVSNTLESKDGLARAKGSMKMNRLQLVKGGAPSGVPVNLTFDITYDLRRNAGTLNQGVVKIGNAVSRLTGTFDRRAESTLLDLKLDGQNLPVQDVQAALPAIGVLLPKGSSLETGTLSAKLSIEGPLDKLVTIGNVGVFNAKLAGFDMGSKMAALSAFSGLQGSGSDTSIQKLTSNVRVESEGIEATHLDLVMPAIGELTGGGTISSGNTLNFKMVATLSARSGIASAVGTLTGRDLSKNARIPFLIQGTTSDPKFVPDVGGIAGRAVESELGKVLGSSPRTEGLSDALGGLFGGKKKKNK
jgi:AsmA protein